MFSSYFYILISNFSCPSAVFIHSISTLSFNFLSSSRLVISLLHCIKKFKTKFYDTIIAYVRSMLNTF